MKGLHAVAVMVSLAAAASNPMEEWRSASEEVEIAGRIFRFRAELWLDRMPIRRDRPLNVRVLLSAVDGEPLPAGLEADRLWVIRGEEVWEAPLEDDSPARPAGSPPPRELERMARNGPDWGTSVPVDVALQVRAAGGETRLLKVSAQSIQEVF